MPIQKLTPENSPENVYVGLTDASLTENTFDLGHGITLNKVYAHLMSPFIMAFEKAEPGKSHPSPWKAVKGGLGFDITAQLYVPKQVAGYDHVEIVTTIMFLLRLWVNPAIFASAISSHPFNELPEMPDNVAQIAPYEIQRKHFALSTPNGEISAASLEWVRDNWLTTVRLAKERKEFQFAIDSISLAQFVPNTGLMIVSLWSALEGLFSPSTTELKFRVSALIASFLAESGEARVKLQKDVARLYDKRSSAAHGKPSHQLDDLLRTFELLRRALIKMIGMGKVPSKNDLEGYLFGSAAS